MEMKKENLFFRVSIVIMLLLFLFHIFLKSKYEVTSDQMIQTIIADGIVKNGMGFWQNYISQQDIMPLHILYYFPSIIFRIFTDDLLVVTLMSFCINTFMLLFVIKSSSKIIFGDNSFKIVWIFILSGLGSGIFRVFIWQEPFYTIVTYLGLFIFSQILKDLKDKHFTLWRFVILLSVVVYSCAVDIRLGSFFCLPFLSSAGIYFLIDNFYESKNIVLKNIFTRLVFWGVAVIAASFFAIIFRSFISSHIYIGERLASFDAFGFTSINDLANNLCGLFISLVSLFGRGFITGKSLLSFEGVSFLISGGMMLLIMFICPWKLLKEYRNLPISVKMFVLFYFSNLALNVLIILPSASLSSTLDVESVSGSRFFVPCVILALMLSGYYWYNYINQSNSFLLKILSITGIAIFIFQSVYFIHLFSATGEASEKQRVSVLETLAERGYHYGYAPYFDASIGTVLTRGEIEIRPVIITGAGISPFYEQSHRDWFKAIPREKSFLMASDGSLGLIESERLVSENVTCTEQLEIDGYKIYLFNGNVVENFAVFEFEEDKIVPLLSRMTIGQHAEKTDEGISMAYGGLIDYLMRYPMKGRYQISLTINSGSENIKDLYLGVQKFKGKKTNDDLYKLNEGENRIDFMIDNPYDLVRIYIFNDKMPDLQFVISDIGIVRMKETKD